jgi:DNA polymerase-1
MQKALWCCEEDYAILKADYSAQEARLVFFLGNQRDIYSKLTAGMDLHAMTLSFIKGVTYDSLVVKTEGNKDKIKPEHDDARSDAKPGSFAPMYGAKARKMAEALSISFPRAKVFMDNYWKTYPEVKKMQDGQSYRAMNLGYVSDLSFGRKRFFFLTQKESDGLLEGKTWDNAAYGRKNPSLNYAAQSTGATILRFALLRVTRLLKDHPEWDATLRLTIHDAMLLTCKVEHAEACGAELKKQMELAATEVVPGISIPVDLDVITDHTAPATFEDYKP